MSYINNSLDIDELYDLHIRIFFEEMRCECKEKKQGERMNVKIIKKDTNETI